MDHASTLLHIFLFRNLNGTWTVRVNFRLVEKASGETDLDKLLFNFLNECFKVGTIVIILESFLHYAKISNML
jgi:hypothetical protein